MNIPSFQEFLNYESENIAKVSYDAQRFSYGRLKEPGNPFSKEEYTLVTETCTAVTLTILSQYHDWLADQLRSNT